MDEYTFTPKISKEEQDIISFYNAYAESWDSRFKNSKTYRLFLDDRYKSFFRVMQQCDIVKNVGIELGVGTGVYIERVSEIFTSVLAVDGSKKMLDILQSKLVAKNIGNVTTMQSNVIDLHEIEDSSADAIFFFGLLEHIIDVDGFLKEIQRVLKKGGYVLGVTPNGSSPWYKLRKFIRKTDKHCTSDIYYSKNDVHTLFSLYGFSGEVVEYWGAYPPDGPFFVSSLLSKSEKYLRKTCLRSLLGGITFAYKK